MPDHPGASASSVPPGGSLPSVDVDQVLAQAVAVLHAFTADDPRLDIPELARRAELPESTVSDIVRGLVNSQLMEPSGDGYRLSTLVFELGMRTSAERRLVEVATPFLEDLYERTRETVHLGVRHHLDVVYVAKIGGHGFSEVPSRIGQRLPLHCTAIGKALLANADDSVVQAVIDRGLTPRGPNTITDPQELRTQLAGIAESGMSFEYEESTPGIACISAAVRGADGEVVAAVSIAGPRYRFVPEQHQIPMRAATDAISGLLGHSGHPH